MLVSSKEAGWQLLPYFSSDISLLNCRTLLPPCETVPQMQHKIVGLTVVVVVIITYKQHIKIKANNCTFMVN